MYFFLFIVCRVLNIFFFFNEASAAFTVLSSHETNLLATAHLWRNQRPRNNLSPRSFSTCGWIEPEENSSFNYYIKILYSSANYCCRKSLLSRCTPYSPLRLFVHAKFKNLFDDKYGSEVTNERLKIIIDCRNYFDSMNSIRNLFIKNAFNASNFQRKLMVHFTIS